MADAQGTETSNVVGPDDVVTWHHGLLARWWANFRLDGPEIEFFRPFVEAGQPALDAACGTGRLLVPWIASGLDVDGVDVSADMIAACRAAADGAGIDPALYVQPLHALDLPRRYGTIVCCGSFGIGASRDQDMEGLRRLLAHLRPGGLLALDYEVGDADVQLDPAWRLRRIDETPPDPADRRLGGDGFEYALRSRAVELVVEGRRFRREMQAWQWRDGELVAHETHLLDINLYDRPAIVAALDAAGFVDVRVVGGYHGGEPTGDEQFLVYLARRP